MVDQTLNFINAHADQPWLVNLWFDDVHTPHAPSDAQLAATASGEGTGTPQFRAVLRATDAEIGRLLAGLRALKQDDKTIVLLAGDNGPEPNLERRRSGGLRGMKWSLYEGGIRTPFAVRCPGVIPPATDSTTVVNAVDFFPTLCAIAGVPAPANTKFDGEDLSSMWKGGGAQPERSAPLFWEYGRQQAGTTDTKGHRGFPYPKEPDAKSPNIAVHDGKWKLLLNADGSGVELYDLATDPNETHNLAEREAATTARLTESALTWQKSLPRD